MNNIDLKVSYLKYTEDLRHMSNMELQIESSIILKATQESGSFFLRELAQYSLACIYHECACRWLDEHKEL